MQNETDIPERINPFLFLLAREILYLETALVFGTATELNVRRYAVLKRPLDINNLPEVDTRTKKEGGKPPPKTSSLGKYLLNQSEDFYFNSYRLGQMTGPIKILGHYPTWQDFVSEYQNSPYAVWAEGLMEVPYQQLNNRVKASLRLYVGETLAGLYAAFILRGSGQTFKTVVDLDEKCVVRQASTKEDFAYLKRALSLCEEQIISSFGSPVLHFTDLKDFCYVVMDNTESLVGSIITLPLKKDFFERQCKGGEIAIPVNAIESRDARQHFWLLALLFHDRSRERHLLGNLHSLLKRHTTEYVVDIATKQTKLSHRLERSGFYRFDERDETICPVYIKTTDLLARAEQN